MLLVAAYGTGLLAAVAFGGTGSGAAATSAIVFRAPDPDVGTADTGVATIDPATGRHRWLLGADARDAEWLRDGTGLVFAAPRGIWFVRADGSARRRVVGGPLNELSSPSVSPDGSTLAYVQGFDIWTVRLDGTGRRRLIADGAEPAWSPDGTRIAFVRGEETVVVAGADGRNGRRIASGAQSPSWSPDGERIAFSWDGLTAAQQGVFTMRPDGTDKRRLVARFVYSQLAWSPDGGQIALSDLDGDLYVVSVERGSAKRLTATDVREELPSWRPDGAELAFTSEVDTELFRTGPRERVVRLTDDLGSVAAPSWSPDGTRISFVGTDGDLYVRRGGGDTRRLTTGLRALVSVITPVKWSPDGSRILVEANGRLLSVRVADGRARTLATSSYTGDWSPDGMRVASSDGEGGVSLVASAGGRPRRITHGFESHHVDWVFVSWSPDGSRIVLTLEGRRLPTLRILDVSGRVIRTTIGGNPSWSADGHALAFERHANSSRPTQVWVTDRNGVRPRFLARGEYPRWAPDGRVALIRRDGIWLAGSSGKLTRVVRMAGISSFDWR